MNREKIKKELDALIDEGLNIHFSNIMNYDNNYFKNSDEKTQENAKEAKKKIKFPKEAYYTWYVKSCEVVHVLSPRRLEEFERFYDGNKTIKKNGDLNVLTAGITHYLQGMSITKDYEEIDFFTTFMAGITAQRRILLAIAKNVDHVLFNLESEIQYGLSKSEIEVAKELKKVGHLKAAGAIAGVVIEGHLKTVAINKGFKLPKKPTMSVCNDILKDNGVCSIPTWRLIQRCGDIRNDCIHSNKDTPTADEVDDIIRAAEKIITEVN